MDVAELLYKVGIVADVKVVVAFLPEVVFGEIPTQAKRRLEWGTRHFGNSAAQAKTGLEWGTRLLFLFLTVLLLLIILFSLMQDESGASQQLPRHSLF